MSNTLTPDSRGRLINLKTNLKNLQFGGDRPASGTSNQPYIVKKIPSGTGYLRDGMPLRSGPDFILRDGFLAPLKALKDISRLAQMFVDTKSPRGLFFTLKQNLLSKASVKTQSSFGLGYFGGAMNQGAYLPIGTLLDAGLGWAGIHLNKNGLNPVGSLGGPAGVNRDATGGSGALNPYSTVVKNNQHIFNNRLTQLQDAISSGEKVKTAKIGSTKSASFFLNSGPKGSKENKDTPILYSYSGGPGSILGIGKTNIFKEQPVYNAIRLYQNLSNSSPLYSGVQPSGVSTLLYGEYLKTYTDTEGGNKKRVGLYPQNFIRYVIENPDQNFLEKEDNGRYKATSKIISISPDYVTQNKALRVGLGDPGQAITYITNQTSRIRNVFDYSVPANEMSALDKITALKIYEGESADDLLPIDDLAQFNIAVIKNGADDGRKAQYLHFRAYINGFTDNYGATWNDIQYVGRGNVFKNYSGFTRDIQMGFTMMATSKAELIPMFTKLNFLSSTLAPDYNKAGFMRGNMVRMTVGGYLNEVPGVLTSLSYTIPDDTTWEVGIDTEGNKDKSVKELPHRIEVSLSFTPIHDFLPQRQSITYDEDTNEIVGLGPERFISLRDKLNNNYEGDEGLPTYSQPVKTKVDSDE